MVYAAIAAGAFVVLSAILIAALYISGPSELATMRISDREMLRFAEEGYFPLAAAAVRLGRNALAFCANLQTFGFIALALLVAGSCARRGFLSESLRGWSNAVWITGLAAICLAPSLFPDLTPQTLDYAVTGAWSGAKATPVDAIYGERGLNRAMLPAVFLVERGLVGGFALFALAYLAHDLGYRVREALEDFGFIEEEQVAAQPKARARSNGTDESARAAGGPEAAFGQRGRGPSRAVPDGPEAHARRVLGVSAAASRREIERAYRSQMKRAHPDHGGSVERAAALNAARDALLRRG